MGGASATVALNATADLGLSLQTVEVQAAARPGRPTWSAPSARRAARRCSASTSMPCASALAALPWIVSAEVERRYPDRLVVTVTEAEPLALWQRKQKLFLVSRDGKVIETADLAQILQAAGDRRRQRAGARREPVRPAGAASRS